MEKFTEKYKDFMFESLQDQLKDKLTEKYVSLKRGILDLLDKSVKDNTKLVNVQNFINSYLKEPEKSNMIGFVQDSEIFDFYLKYQNNIDELCNDKNYFDEVPKSNNIFSLYKYIIEGTKFAVIETLKIMENELFKA